MTETPTEVSGEKPSEKKAAGRSLTKLNMRRTVLVTLPFMGALTFWQAYDGLVPLMFKNTFGMGDTLTGVFMSLDNVLALFMLPLMGRSPTVPPRAGAGARRSSWWVRFSPRRSRPSLPWQTRCTTCRSL